MFHALFWESIKFIPMFLPSQNVSVLAIEFIVHQHKLHLLNTLCPIKTKTVSAV